MFAEAVREIRFHPGRFVATLIAIAISVGFMAAVSVFMASQTNAMGRMFAVQTSAADAVVTVSYPKETTTPQMLATAIESVPGVAAQARVATQTAPVTANGQDQWTNIVVLPPEQFRWSTITQGRWPSTPLEMALAPDLAKALKVAVGDSITVMSQVKLTVVGITNDPKNLIGSTAYLAVPTALGQSQSAQGDWLVKLEPGADQTRTLADLATAVKPLGEKLEVSPSDEAPDPMQVRSAAQFQQDKASEALQGLQPLKWMLMVFAGIALLVGMIIIANTFSILLAQRRRQIGLLRAVGAFGGQVRSRFLAESVLLGVLGSVLGVGLGALIAVVGLMIAGSLGWGVKLPWGELLLEVLVGTLITVAAAMGPAWRATRVMPLEALQPVATVERRKRISRVRLVICLALIALGIGLSVLSLALKDAAVPLALGAGFALTFGILGAAPLFIPVLLRGFARLVERGNPTARLAAVNAVRNPTRASATATALMLAVGLIVTLQVGTATVRRTMTEEINATFPIDMMIEQKPDTDQPTASGMSKAIQQRVAALRNIDESVVMKGGWTKAGDPLWVYGFDPALRRLTSIAPESLDDRTILVSGYAKDLYRDGEQITLTGDGGTITGTVRYSTLAGEALMVSQANLARLVKAPVDVGLWLKLGDRAKFGDTISDTEKLQADVPNLQIGGGAMQAWILDTVLNVLLLITSGLLGVAVLIALVGVANTLGLSVIERQRESALLRALGMQRSSLRWMLLVEALILALVGTLVGILAGAYFGWLGVRAVISQMSVTLDNGLQFAVDWRWTLGMIALAVVAAGLASIGPGRRAALATPTEALADE